VGGRARGWVAVALSVAGTLAVTGTAAAAPNQTVVCAGVDAVQGLDLGCQVLDVDGQAIAALADVADTPCAIVGEHPYEYEEPRKPVELCARQDGFRWPTASSYLGYVYVDGLAPLASTTRDTNTECGNMHSRGLSVLAGTLEVYGVDRSRWNC
jgi:hypothetical protein